MHEESSTGVQEYESNVALTNGSALPRAEIFELLGQMFTNSPNPIVVVDETGTIVLSSGGITKLLGFEPLELVGEPLDVLLMPEHRASHSVFLRQFFQVPTERPMGHGKQLVARKRDGIAHAVDISLRHVEFAEHHYAVAEIRDALEHAGREFAERLGALIDSSEDAIMEGDLDTGTIRHWNRGAEEMFGYTESEMLGKSPAVLQPPDLAVPLENIYEKLRRGERVRIPHVQRVAKDGSVIDVALSITPIPDRTGAFTSASSISRNITQQLAAERARTLLELRVSQSERMESLGQLAGGVAHDFNNLLFLISIYTGLVKGKLADMPDVSADLEKIEVATKQAGTLTRRLLTFARREIVDSRSLALNALIADLAELLGQSLGEHIELAIHPLAAHDNVVADPGQIEQVLLNVVLNSRDAMPEGGTLRIETKNVDIDAKSAAEYSSLSEGKYILMEITDTGSGMDANVLERIFEPFFTTKNLGDGTGLGMSMAFGVVTQVGGDIRFYSELGVGTTCRILLPLSEQAAPMEASSPEELIRGRGETVLVVEDVVAIREMIERILLANGYQVLIGESSPGAIAFLESHEGTIDLLLTDVIMPEKSGRAVADAYKSVRPGGPVLFMSGYAEPATLVELNYAYTLLQKPFSENELLVTIRNLLDQANAVDSSSA